jgi:hypothetical protein
MAIELVIESLNSQNFGEMDMLKPIRNAFGQLEILFCHPHQFCEASCDRPTIFSLRPSYGRKRTMNSSNNCLDLAGGVERVQLANVTVR